MRPPNRSRPSPGATHSITGQRPGFVPCVPSGDHGLAETAENSSPWIPAMLTLLRTATIVLRGDQGETTASKSSWALGLITFMRGASAHVRQPTVPHL